MGVARAVCNPVPWKANSLKADHAWCTGNGYLPHVVLDVINGYQGSGDLPGTGHLLDGVINRSLDVWMGSPARSAVD